MSKPLLKHKIEASKEFEDTTLANLASKCNYEAIPNSELRS